MCFRPPSIDMPCPKCKAIVPPGATACPSCGNTQMEVGASAPPPVPSSMKGFGTPKMPSAPKTPKAPEV